MAAANNAKASPKTIAAKEKAAQALELRKEGHTYTQIAEAVGYNSRQAAYDAVKRSILAIIKEPAEEVIRLELERLDVLWQMQYLNAQSGDVNALGACLKIMERRARLLGIEHIDITTKGESLNKGRDMADFYADVQAKS